MGTKNYIADLEYTESKGLDTTSPTTLMSPGYVREALNANLGSTGGYFKRDGFVPVLGTPYPDAYVGPNLIGFNIRQGLEFKTSTPEKQTLLFATQNQSSQTNAFLGKVVGVNLVPVILGFGDNGRPSFAQVLDSLFVFDSSFTLAPQAYEITLNNASRTLGIAFPTNPNPLLTSAPSKVGDLTFLLPPVVSAGGELNEGDYLYAYTYAYYLNNTLIAESSPSDISLTVTTTAANKTVTMALIALPGYANANLNHLVKKTRIWRTVVNGNILFALAEQDSLLTSYVDVLSDDSLLSEQMPEDNSQLSEYSAEGFDQPRFPVVARNRLLVFHKTQNRGRFSKLGPNGPLPESFPVANEFSVEGQYGSADAIVGAGSIKGVPIILKERSIGKLEEIGLPDLGNNEDSVAFMYREIGENVGAVSHSAQTMVLDELVFLGRDNIYATNGEAFRPIATSIQATIKACDFNPAKTPKISCVNDSKNKRIYMQVFANTSDSEPSLTFVGDYQQYPNFRWTTYGSGPDSTTYPGLKAGCFFQSEATSDGGLDIFFGNTGKNGQYYKMNTGTSDVNQSTLVLKPIYFKVISRPYMLSNPMVQKLYKNAKIFVQAVDDTYDFEFCAIFDLSFEEEKCQDFTILGIGTTWDNYDWAPDAVDPELIWSGPALSELTYDPHRKAKTMQLVFKQTTIDAPLTLLGWGVAGSIFSGI